MAFDLIQETQSHLLKLLVNDQLRTILDELQILKSTTNENDVFLSMSRFLKYKADHILFWLFTVFFHGYTQLELIERGGILAFLLEIVIRNGLLAISIYWILLKAIPLLTRDKALKGSGIILGSLLFYVVVKNFHDLFVINPLLLNDEFPIFHRTFYNGSIVLFYTAFATTLYLSKQWFQQREEIRKMEVEKLNTELNYLRAQMNPHFLFNSINTIFFQIDKGNAAARDTLNKFSDLLRYQLYECNNPEISIEKEMHYLKNYIDLQRLRMNENFKIEFIVDDSLRNFSLPPLLLLPFVENAFKHVSHFSQKSNEILIRVFKKEQQLFLLVSNTVEDYVEPTTHGGIGLANIKRRLNLIYGQRHELLIDKGVDRFEVKLRIPIV